MNRVVTALLGAAASLGALPELPTRFDRQRPEPAAVQARIQAAASAKRAQRAKRRSKNQELTALGRTWERMRVQAQSFERVETIGNPHDRSWGAMLWREWQKADVALNARRGQP